MQTQAFVIRMLMYAASFFPHIIVLYLCPSAVPIILINLPEHILFTFAIILPH
jgi:hypothetical protein